MDLRRGRESSRLLIEAVGPPHLFGEHAFDPDRMNEPSRSERGPDERLLAEPRDPVDPPAKRQPCRLRHTKCAPRRDVPAVRRELDPPALHSVESDPFEEEPALSSTDAVPRHVRSSS